jgi:hypothetical protein
MGTGLALERARIVDEIARLPEQLSAPVLEHGAEFSGGQCRRLALARAFCGDHTSSSLTHQPPISVGSNQPAPTPELLRMRIYCELIERELTFR